MFRKALVIVIGMINHVWITKCIIHTGLELFLENPPGTCDFGSRDLQIDSYTQDAAPKVCIARHVSVKQKLQLENEGSLSTK